jgi:hypothetical protein
MVRSKEVAVEAPEPRHIAPAGPDGNVMAGMHALNNGAPSHTPAIRVH